MNNQIVPVKDTQMEAYGSREVVREMVSRLMGFHPAARDVGERGMLAAAQLAIFMGASPLPGLNEIHIHPDGKVQLGINYWRRQGEEQGGYEWTDRPRPMNEDERTMYGIVEDQYGAICTGIKMSTIHKMRDAGLPINNIYERQGITGIGTCGKSGLNKYGKPNVKKGRPVIWTAIKRAETDFLKQAFPFMMGDASPGGGMSQDSQGGYAPDYGPQWGQLDPSLRDDIDSDATIIDMEAENELLFGDGNQQPVQEVVEETGEIIEGESEPQEWPRDLAEFAKMYADENEYYKNNYHVVGQLKKDFGDDIGITFKNRETIDYLKALEKHADEESNN